MVKMAEQTSTFIEFLKEKLGKEPTWYDYMKLLNEEIATVRDRFGELKYGVPNIELELKIALAGFSPTGRDIGNGRYGIVSEYLDKSGNLWGIKRLISDEDAKKRREQRGITEQTMLEKEAISLEACQHNIVPRIVGDGFIAMPLFPNDLEQILEDGKPLETKKAIQISKNILHGLGYAHKELRRVHSDLKPDNILLDKNGIAYITDFGISSEASISRQSKDPRDNFGFLYTSSPERFQEGNHMNEKSDVWAAGALIGRLVTGKYPLEKLINGSSNPKQRINESTQTETSSMLESYFSQVPRWLNSVLRKALSYDPNTRFADASEMEQAFLNAEENFISSSSRLTKWVIGTIVSLSLLGSITGLSIYESKSKRLEDQVQTQEQKIELGEKIKIINLYLQKKENNVSINHQVTTRTEHAEEGKLLGYLERFEDERTAFAAYINPRAVFAAIKLANSERYAKIGETLCKIDPKSFYELESNVSYWRFPESPVSYVCIEEKRKQNKDDVKLEFKSLERDYLIMQKLEEWYKQRNKTYEEKNGIGMSWQSFYSSLDDSDRRTYDDLLNLRERFYQTKINGGKNGK
ncbi:Serine/threonine-protein kinase PknD [uncultured archaeon]|nr:Serine/threonine-protein kinase PknD [uncultured archaeon]